MIKRSEDWNLVYQALSANSAIKSVRNNKAEVQTVEKYSTKRFLHLLSVSVLLYKRYVQLLLLKYCKAKFIVRQQSRLFNLTLLSLCRISSYRTNPNPSRV